MIWSFCFLWTWRDHVQVHTHPKVEDLPWILVYEMLFLTPPSAVHVRHPVIRSHGESRAEQTDSREEPRFLITGHGTPKGQAAGPEKPAAWDYYSHRGAAQEQQVSKRGASSSSPCSLSSSSRSHKHSDSHRKRTHTEASLLVFF